jgi:alkylation response protein AidB-like acyl-CoA dehydrogenase
MDFELSDDQVALQDAARELLDGLASPTQVRAVVDAGGGIDDKLWAAMLEQGWTAIAVPEALGGIGLGTVELAVLVEQVGAHVAPAPIVQQLVAIDALVRTIAEPEIATSAGLDVAALTAVLDRLVAGEALATVASTSVGARPHVDDGVVTWSLTGRTEPALFAPSATYAVVRAHDLTDPSGDGIGVGDDALYLVDLAAAGLAPGREPAMDLTRELGWLQLDATPALRLGGSDAVDAFVDVGAALLSAELLGASNRAMDLAVDYAKDREQFGRPIGSFQAVKHRCADMLVDVEGMRSAVYYAAWCIAADDDDRSIAASTAKTWCSDAAKRVMASSLQVHGGIGFTWECDVHLFLKRAQVDQTSFGDAVVHRARLAERLRAKVSAGESVI